jgi:hypothetical protein
MKKTSNKRKLAFRSQPKAKRTKRDLRDIVKCQVERLRTTISPYLPDVSGHKLLKSFNDWKDKNTFQSAAIVPSMQVLDQAQRIFDQVVFGTLSNETRSGLIDLIGSYLIDDLSSLSDWQDKVRTLWFEATYSSNNSGQLPYTECPIWFTVPQLKNFHVDFRGQKASFIVRPTFQENADGERFCWFKNTSVFPLTLTSNGNESVSLRPLLQMASVLSWTFRPLHLVSSLSSVLQKCVWEKEKQKKTYECNRRFITRTTTTTTTTTDEEKIRLTTSTTSVLNFNSSSVQLTVASVVGFVWDDFLDHHIETLDKSIVQDEMWKRAVQAAAVRVFFKWAKPTTAELEWLAQAAPTSIAEWNKTTDQQLQTLTKQIHLLYDFAMLWF